MTVRGTRYGGTAVRRYGGTAVRRYGGRYTAGLGCGVAGYRRITYRRTTYRLPTFTAWMAAVMGAGRPAAIRSYNLQTL
jgi:hypothetical protein